MKHPKPYVVNIGYDRNGRERNKRYATEQEARDVVAEVFRRTGILLSIVKKVDQSSLENERHGLSKLVGEMLKEEREIALQAAFGGE